MSVKTTEPNIRRWTASELRRLPAAQRGCYPGALRRAREEGKTIGMILN